MIVCDTNVLLSAFLFPGGFPDKIMRAIFSGRLKHFTSPDILTELKGVLRRKFSLTTDQIEDLLSLVVENSQMIYPTERITVIKKDDADNRVLECAFTAEAKFLITGDHRHLLVLKKYRNTKIISPRDFAVEHNLL